MLINELAELPSEVVMVLDDYQLVTEGDCHESVAFFVDHLPAIFTSSSQAALTRRCRLGGAGEGRDERDPH